MIRSILIVLLLISSGCGRATFTKKDSHESHKFADRRIVSGNAFCLGGKITAKDSLFITVSGTVTSGSCGLGGNVGAPCSPNFFVSLGEGAVLKNLSFDQPLEVCGQSAISGSRWGYIALSLKLPSAPNPPQSDKPRTIFVSSSSISGNMGSINTADSKCQALAAAAGLSGSFIALLSTGGLGARDRIGSSGAISNTRGEIVAKRAADLFDGSLLRPIFYDENRALVPSPYVWTGSSAVGNVMRSKVDGSIATCSNWGFNSGDPYAAVGLSDRASGAWLLYDSDYKCSNHFRIYCITK